MSSTAIVKFHIYSLRNAKEKKEKKVPLAGRGGEVGGGVWPWRRAGEGGLGGRDGAWDGTRDVGSDGGVAGEGLAGGFCRGGGG